VRWCKTRAVPHLLRWLGHQRDAVLLAVIQCAVTVVGWQRCRRHWWDGLCHFKGLQGLCWETKLTLHHRTQAVGFVPQSGMASKHHAMVTASNDAGSSILADVPWQLFWLQCWFWKTHLIPLACERVTVVQQEVTVVHVDDCSHPEVLRPAATVHKPPCQNHPP
jgi:hypothetical protein